MKFESQNIMVVLFTAVIFTVSSQVLSMLLRLIKILLSSPIFLMKEKAMLLKISLGMDEMVLNTSKASLELAWNMMA